MTARTAVLVSVLAAAGIAVAGCGGGGSPSSAAPQSPTLPTGALNQPTTSPGATAKASGQAGDDKGGTRTGGGGGSDDTSAAPVATSADGLPAPAGNNKPGALPAGFPLPSGTTTGRISVRATEIAAPLLVPDGDQATAFWRTQLPAAGYTVTSIKVKQAFGTILFTGKGCIAGSDIQVSGEHIAFLCKRKG